MSNRFKVLFGLRSETPCVESTLVIEVERTVMGEAFRRFCGAGQPSYLHTTVTRLIAPEYIIQMGDIPAHTLAIDHPRDSPLSSLERKILYDTAPRLGCVYAARCGESTQFFITLVNIERFAEEVAFKGNYVFIGRVIKGFTRLVEWLPTVEVDAEHQPLKPIRIVGCEVLQSRRKERDPPHPSRNSSNRTVNEPRDHSSRKSLDRATREARDGTYKRSRSQSP